MSATELLRLIVDADTKGAVAGMEKLGATAKKELDASQQRLDKWGSGLTKAGVGMMTVGTLALAGLGGMAAASEEANLATVKLQNTLDKMPKLAGENAKQFTDLADAIQAKTAADGDQIVAAEAMLGTFNLTAQEIKGITPLVVDYARKFGVDMVDAATQVGKALDGNVGALKRNGVSIDEVMFKTDKYGAVQQALSSQVGGFAEAEGATFAGSLQRMKNELGDLSEGVGKGAVDAFTTMFGVVDKAANALESISPGAQSAIGEVATFGGIALVAVGGVSTLVGQLIKMRDNFSAVSNAVQGLSFSGVATGLGVIAPLAIAAGVALAQYSKVKAEAKRVTDGYVKALDEEIGATCTATDSYTSAELTSSSFGSALRDNQADLALFNEAIRSQGGDLDEFRKNLVNITDRGFGDWMTDSGVKTSALTDELARLDEQMSTEDFANLIIKLENLSDGYDNATEKTRNQKFAEGELDSQHKTTAGSTDEMTGALGEEAAAADTAKSAIQEYNDALKAQFDPLFGAINATQQLVDAKGKVTEAGYEAAVAEQEHGAGSLEAMVATDKLRQAQIDEVEAAVRQQSAMLSLKDAVDKGTVSVDDAKNMLAQWVAQGVITQESADTTAREIEGMNAAAEQTPSEKSIAFGTPGLNDARTNITNLKDSLHDIPAHVSTTIDITTSMDKAAALLGFGVPHRAAGGPVSRGGLYEVAENNESELYTAGGRSYLIAGASGHITPMTYAGGDAPGGSGGNWTETIIVKVGEDELARAVRRSDRRNSR